MGIKESLSSVVNRVFPESKRRRAAVWLAERLWRIDCEGEENLRIAREHLQKGSLLLIFNHTFAGDVFCAGGVCGRELMAEVRHLFLPASRRHLDVKRGVKNLLGNVINSDSQGNLRKQLSSLDKGEKLKRFLGGFWEKPELKFGESISFIGHAVGIRAIVNLIKAELFDIVQSYDVDYYGREEASSSWKKLFRGVEEELLRPGTLMFLAPEGHRSDDGNLQRADSGFVHFLRLGRDDCLCLPLGIEAEKGVRGLGFFKRVKVRIGEPFRYDDCLGYVQGEGNSRQEMADGVMRERIAPLIPEDHWGYYQDFDLSSTALPLDR